MKQKQNDYRSMLIDVALICFAYIAAIYARYHLLNGYRTVDPFGYSYLLTVGLYALLSVFAQCQYGVYNRYQQRKRHVLKIIWIHTIGVMSLLGLLYMVKELHFSRSALLLFYLFTCILICAHYLIRIMISNRRRAYSEHDRQMIVLGNGRLAKQYIEDVTLHPEWGCKVKGYVSAVARNELGTCLGSYEQLSAILDTFPQSELVVALEEHETQWLANILSIAEKAGTHIYLIPFYNDAIPANAYIENYNRSRLIDLRKNFMDDPWSAFVKRMMDVLLASILLVFASPFMLITALLVKTSSPGPILFKQNRIGKDKKPFVMYKFRSMVMSDADKTAWTSPNDPRTTTIGHYIRKYSIDELPQLFNVIKGDMSLVGPRPEIPYHVDHFKNEISRYLLRQQVKPGMTGWAQVHGLRGDTSIQARVDYDLWYIENWSIALDVKILFMTAFGGIINKEEK